MAAISLQLCSVADTAQIAALADKIWHQHYRTIIGEEQIRYMLSLMYSQHSLREQMQEKNHLFYFIMVNAQCVGFLSVHRVEGDHWFLNKFYIDQHQAAKGIGTAAFNELVKLNHIQSCELTVNRQNYKSINFYFKLGFKIKAVADFDIGNGYMMNDFIMLRNTC